AIDVRATGLRRKGERAIEGNQLWRQWQRLIPLRLIERLEWREDLPRLRFTRPAHPRTPQMVRNSLRSAGLAAYSPRQTVVRVSGDVSCTPRICVHKWCASR